MNAMRNRSPDCIIFMFISGMCGVVSGSWFEVRQLVGDKAIIQCPFQKELGPQPKSFQRDSNGLSENIIETARSESCISSGRYSLCNEAQSNKVTVTITIHNLMLDDAGDYRCCAKTGWRQDPCHHISLDVYNQTTTTTVTPPVPMTLPTENPQSSLTTTTASSLPSSLASSMASSASTSESSSSPSPPSSASLLSSSTSLLGVLSMCAMVVLVLVLLLFVWYKHIRARQAEFTPPRLPTNTTNQTSRPQGTDSGQYVNAQHKDIQVNYERGQSVCSLANDRPGTGEDNPDYSYPPACVRFPDFALHTIPYPTPTRTPTLSLSPIPSSTSSEPLYQSLNPTTTPEEVDYLSLQPTTSISADYLSPHPGVIVASTGRGSPSYLSLDSHHTSLSDTIYDSLQ